MSKKINLLLYFLSISLLTALSIELLSAEASIGEILGVFFIGFASFTWFQAIIFFTYFLLLHFKTKKVISLLMIPVLTILMNWILAEAGFFEVHDSLLSAIILFQPTSLFALFLLVAELSRLFWGKKKQAI